MKRILTVALGITMAFLLAGCSAEKPAPDPTSGMETQSTELIVISPFGSGAFIDVNTEPVAELPEGYGYIGDLSEDHVSEYLTVASKLKGCRMYANLALDSSECEDVYLYQPVGESDEEWAYVRYVKLKYGEV